MSSPHAPSELGNGTAGEVMYERHHADALLAACQDKLKITSLDYGTGDEKPVSAGGLWCLERRLGDLDYPATADDMRAAIKAWLGIPCGHAVPENARYCPECGRSASPRPLHRAGDILAALRDLVSEMERQGELPGGDLWAGPPKGKYTAICQGPLHKGPRTFYTSTKWGRYCSNACRQAGKRQRDRQAKAVTAGE